MIWYYLRDLGCIWIFSLYPTARLLPPQMQVLHPIIVHFPPTLALLALVAAVSELRFGNRAVTVALATGWWISCLMALLSGLFDEDSARQMLARGWMLDDHRFAGIAAVIIGAFCWIGTATHRYRRALPVAVAWACVVVPVAITWIAVYLGHQAVHVSPWQP